MSEPFLGEISPVAFEFAPKNYALCNGQILPISQNQALFALLGTTYGGDGRTTFALPDLRSRVIVHSDGGNFPLGSTGGVEAVSLTQSQIAAHSHAPACSSLNGNTQDTTGAIWAHTGATDHNIYSTGAPDSIMEQDLITPAGGNLPHPNLQPYLVVNFIIALAGIFPSRN
jgi:microcystin-dependent protein